MVRHQISKGAIRKKAPPFYNLHDDDFYHGPAWVIKPKLFPPKDKFIHEPGPASYHIPERSIYVRPGKTIASRYETNLPISNSLLGRYSPKEHYTSNAKMYAISITPRRIEPSKVCHYYGRLYSPSKSMRHCQSPLIRPLYGPIISRKSLKKNMPGPTAYQFNEYISSRTKPGFKQKHRLLLDRKKMSPPFYYSKPIDRHNLPSFTIGKRLFTLKKANQCSPSYHRTFNDKNLCSKVIRPGVTLKGRWSPYVFNGINNVSKNCY